ncbi:unnamed protein product [Knipowitschia caucasica]|uniref:ADM2 n=1 Tax=Knipowitschia caucasica TaxID=637954 RepID=A0AAV2KVT9_KNICA
MCTLLWAWICLLLSILPPETQALTLTHRQQHTETPGSVPSISGPPVPIFMDHGLQLTDTQLIWNALVHKDPPTPHSRGTAAGAGLVRVKRHVNSIGGRAHLMRVGCVLGTCQVQNLSHRLYQLIGQSGREDSSPINPRSPHSYG